MTQSADVSVEASGARLDHSFARLDHSFSKTSWDICFIEWKFVMAGLLATDSTDSCAMLPSPQIPIQ